MSEKLNKIFDNAEIMVNALLNHVHKCDHACCVKDVLKEMYREK